ncbi:histidine kinase/DNA gyrase B/HSP90-like ATPase [Kordia periserrulae]|uniref:site-specific DNA-methyltransferase (adenine-specific) n=1 Tax=Kordia periserrulae TaxID=701523 RepID=A0A2T6BYG5_9FLAO|nr:N-6 DNA methylase [Kordia periserrulae]PTX61112.1 histidine kinase/DNA gyrase B/HSP90-like ATPase [Kordia periserrulae]
MEDKKFLQIVAVLRTLKNTSDSNLSKIDALILECFLLILKKENILQTGIINYNSNRIEIKDTMSSLIKNALHFELEELYESYIYHLISIVKKYYFSSLISIITNIQNDFIEEKGTELFEFLLGETGGYRDAYADALQPQEVTKIINHFKPKRANYSYYNPFAGFASLAIDLPDTIEYIGEELNIATQVLAKLRLLIHDKPSSFILEQKDSLEDSYVNRKYNFIAFNPPFNLKFKRDLDYLSHKNKYFLRNNANAYIISECFKKLKKGGKMVFVMPNGFLYSKNKRENALKKFLVENQYLETIIALPSNILNFSSIPVNVIVLNKDESSGQHVRFIDATELHTKADGKRNVVKVDKVLSLIDSDTKNQLVRDISFQEIATNQYNLSVNRYVFEELEISEENKESLVPLKKILKRLPRVKPKQREGRFIRIRDLSDDETNLARSFDELEERELKSNANVLVDNCILLSTLHASLKPTIYKKEKHLVFYPRPMIFAATVDEAVVDIEYLVLELQKEYVLKQLKRNKTTGAIQKISINDLLTINVVLPSLEEQKSKKFAYKEKIVSNKLTEVKELKESYGIDVADENSFLRHQIAGRLKNIRGALSAVQQIIKEQVVKEMPEVLSLKRNEKLQQTLGGYLQILERDITDINKSVNIAGQEIDLTAIKYSKIEVLKFLTNYVEEIQDRDHNIFEITLDKDLELLKESDVKGIYIDGDKEYLRRIFDNIIENAEKHAFENQLNTNNKIKVELQYDFENLTLQIDFTNNGNSLPKDFTLEAYTRKGSMLGKNAGNGLGGWLINEVVKKHKGKLNITDKTSAEMLESEDITTIEIKLPITLKE